MRTPHFILLVFLALSAALRAESWEIVRFEGRDYIPLQNIARFYGFNEWPAPETQLSQDNKLIAYDSGANQLAVRLDSREAEINGAKRWLAFPVRLHENRLIVSRLDLAKNIEPALRPEMISGFTPVQTVVLDPGHGGHDRGAYSRYGYEKELALDVAKRTKSVLESRGFKVVMTRTTDVFIPLQDRPKVANAIPNSIFVSIHFNSSSINPFASGFEIFSVTPRGAPSMDQPLMVSRDLKNEPGNAVDVPSSALASTIHHAMIGTIPQVDRGIKNQRFAVLRLSKVPSVLVECGFLSSPSESQLAGTASWRQQLAEAIAAGIGNYKLLAEQRQKPKVIADYRRSSPSSVMLRDSDQNRPGNSGTGSEIARPLQN
jgi:N-acetylmuramoyl-L-alanine amidase